MSGKDKVVVLWVACLAAGNCALAQTAGTATLVGTVTDGTGAVIAQAKVTVVNVETSFTTETSTSAEGTYYAPYLAPGTYRLAVEAAGFKRYVREGIEVRTSEMPRIDVQLEIGSLTESVSVTAAAPLLETETSSSGQILSGATILRIPVTQKRALRMMYYYPGTTTMSGYHVLGQRQNMVGFSVDGVSGKEPGTQNVAGPDEQLSTTQDAYEEVKVHTTGVPAEYGHSAGGLLSIVFRSGANQFHGAFEDRYIGQKMIHRSYLEQLRSTNPFVYHETSALASGPVLLPKLYNGRDRTFWLIGLARHHENSGVNAARTTVPTAAMYNGDFSFGGQTSPRPLPVYNPFSTRQEGSTWVRDPFPGNLVPRSLFDPAVQKFLSLNPFREPSEAGIPTATGPIENLVMNQERQIRRTRMDFKLDHQFTSSHKAFARYSRAWHRAWKGDYQAQFLWRDIDPNAQPSPVDQYNAVFSDMMILSPTMNNEFRAGFNRRYRAETALTADQDWARQLGIPNVDGATFPYFNVGFGLAGLSGFQQIGEDITLQDNFTRIAGKHMIKLGYELIRTRYNATTAVLPGGSYSFGGTNAPFVPNTGQTFASFLLGTVSSATFTQRNASWLPRWWSHQWYVQDDWKPRPGLTFNLGLRWSYETPFRTRYGQNSVFDAAAADPVTGRRGAIVHRPGPLATNDWNNFAPRLGVAWTVRPNIVFRSSFGVIHQDVFTVGTGILFEEYIATATIQQPTGDPRHAFRLSEGPPAFQYRMQADGSVPFVGTNYSSRAASLWDPNMRLPYVMSWSGGVQWQFARQWLLETIYQGQSGVGLVNSWDVNAIPLDISSDPATLNQIYQSTQNYKPAPHFGSVNLFSNFGHNSHHSGTVRVEKRHSAGLTMNAFYTYGKTISETDSEGGGGGVTYYNRRLEKARASYDLRSRFVGILTYELPFGRGRRWLSGGGLADHFAGGWEITLVQTLQSGTPFTVTFSGSPNRYLPGSSRPNPLLPVGEARTPAWEIGPNRFPTSAQNPYLRFDAFGYPAAFTPGAMGRNMFEGPGLNWTQVSLGKWWKFGERFRLQLRFDGNNWPLKQPNFSNPSATYNRNSPGNFGRMTGVQGSFSNIGTGRPNLYAIVRVEF